MARFHRFTALLLALLLVVSLLPAQARAEEPETISFDVTYVNPLYADVITEADLLSPAFDPPRVYSDGADSGSDPEYLTDMEEAGAVLREFMKNREETATVYIWVDNADEEYLKAQTVVVKDAAVKHTGVPTEGDYLGWQYGGYSAKISGHQANGGYNVTFTYTLTYYTTPEQEAKVDAAVEKLLLDLDLDLKSDYQKAKAIYDYICANVTYDKAHVKDTSYTLQFTAYAALINKTAVCQGYSVLLYRLLLESGIDCRFIAGTGNGGNHGWNILELADLYYNADSTWDAGESEYDYFLKCEANFGNHQRSDEYNTSEFHSAYPMSSKDYTPTTCSGEHVWNQGTITKEPTEFETGIRTYTCRNCGEHKTEEIAKLPHTHSYTQTVTESTCTEEGYTTYTCACGDSYVDNKTEPLGHDLEAPVPDTEANTHTSSCSRCDCSETEDCIFSTETVTDPTCTENGYTTHACACGNSYKDDYVDAKGHTEVTDAAKEATCTETGLTEGMHCSACNEVLIAQDEVPAKGHSWNNGEVTKEPTETETGIRTFTCTVCEETRTEEIPAIETVTRVAGKDRIETALEIAEALKEALNKDEFDTIIVANGENAIFADALSGSYLANAKGAPILLYTKNGMAQSNLDYIAENLSSAGTIYLLGGTSVIPEEVADTLKGYAKDVIRLAGPNRYDTNLSILNEVGVEDGQKILIASGEGYADSLSASATGLPILLVGPKYGLFEEQIAFLENHKNSEFIILGGTAAISDEMKKEIEELVDAKAEFVRLAGKTRENTSASIAAHFFDSADFAVIAYSQGSADGLAGGPLAFAKGAPLLLTCEGKESLAAEYLNAHSITAGYVLGGTAGLKDENVRAVFGLPDNAVIGEN